MQVYFESQKKCHNTNMVCVLRHRLDVLLTLEHSMPAQFLWSSLKRLNLNIDERTPHVCKQGWYLNKECESKSVFVTFVIKSIVWKALNLFKGDLFFFVFLNILIKWWMFLLKIGKQGIWVSGYLIYVIFMFLTQFYGPNVSMDFFLGNGRLWNQFVVSFVFCLKTSWELKKFKNKIILQIYLLPVVAVQLKLDPFHIKAKS